MLKGQYAIMALAVVVMFVSANCVHAAPPPPPPPPPPPHWLVQFWPPEYIGKVDPTITRKDFFIHGLWPQQPYQKYQTPAGVTDVETVVNSDPQLNSDMPNYWKSFTWNPNAQFWTNEWNKHGIYQYSLNMENYFKRTIERVKQADILSALQSNGVKPDDNWYPENRFKRAIRGVIGHDPILLCNNGNILREVAICVGKDAMTFLRCNPTRSGSVCTGGNIQFVSWKIIVPGKPYEQNDI